MTLPAASLHDQCDSGLVAEGPWLDLEHRNSPAPVCTALWWWATAGSGVLQAPSWRLLCGLPDPGVHWPRLVCLSWGSQRLLPGRATSQHAQSDVASAASGAHGGEARGAEGTALGPAGHRPHVPGSLEVSKSESVQRREEAPPPFIRSSVWVQSWSCQSHVYTRHRTRTRTHKHRGCRSVSHTQYMHM